MKTKIYFIFLLSIYLIKLGNCLQINVIPTYIEPGTTENLLVNCSLNVEKTPELAFLNSLVLSRSVGMNKSDYQVVASINTVGHRVNVYDVNGVGSGVVSNKGESYLSVQWAYPLNEMAGTYICQANGMSLSWKPQTYTVLEETTSSAVTQSFVTKLLRSIILENVQKLEKINKLTQKVKTLENHFNEKINRLEDNAIATRYFINNLKDENKEALETLFFVSTDYSGRRYYLSKESALVTYTSAQVTCAKYGGYLARIDDDEEFNFVRRFLRERLPYATVIISGSDEGHEGYYTHPNNNTEIKFIKWGKGDPNGGIIQNCLCLWKESDWYFGDIMCVTYDINMRFGYLCEI